LLYGEAGKARPLGICVQPAALSVAFEDPDRSRFGQHPVTRFTISQGRHQLFPFPAKADLLADVDEVGGGAAKAFFSILQRYGIDGNKASGRGIKKARPIKASRHSSAVQVEKVRGIKKTGSGRHDTRL